MQASAFLVDMNLPASLARAPTDAGFRAAHVRERGLGSADDEAIVEHARARFETIVTNYLDFGRILAVQGTTAPSVVVLRLRDLRPTVPVREADAGGQPGPDPPVDSSRALPRGR